jgi:COP9 signalosome complex subunit 4
MDQFSQTIESAIASNDYTSLARVFGHGPQSFQSMGQGEQRSLAAFFLKTAVNSKTFLPAAFSSAQAMGAFEVALPQLPATVENAADSKLRQMMFDYKVNEEEDYSGAARILGGMRMETTPESVYYLSPAEMCDVYVKIAECFLEEDETVEADAAVTKAGGVVENITDPEQHMALILRFKSTYARVLDSNRKFSSAASRYHDLSQSTTDLIEADDLLQMLGRAATCAILSSGPQRQRVLGLVYKDPRLSQLESIPAFEGHATILKKMYTNQVLKKEELVKFEASLADHQKAIMGDGMTILERAVLEHNMLAVSKLYSSIYFSELGRILGVDAFKAEKIAANMIMNQVFGGTIDQVEGLLNFASDETEQQKWDKSIISFCSELNMIAEEIKAESQ